MLKIKPVSDLHTEFYLTTDLEKRKRILENYLPPHADDAETVLCLAGDTGLFKEYDLTLDFPLRCLAERFRNVVVIGGNHELYGTRGLWGKEKEFLADKEHLANVHWLENEYVVIDDVVFLGATLWTDFDRRNPLAMLHAKGAMNDFQCIAKEDINTYRRAPLLDPEDTVVRHEETVAWLKDTLAMFRDRRKMVITHHAPAQQSVDPRYKGDLLNGAYMSDLSELMELYEPDVWLHGHMHGRSDYQVGKTRVICNACGYHNQEVNNKFDPRLIVEL